MNYSSIIQMFQNILEIYLIFISNFITEFLSIKMIPIFFLLTNCEILS